MMVYEDPTNWYSGFLFVAVAWLSIPNGFRFELEHFCVEGLASELLVFSCMMAFYWYLELCKGPWQVTLLLPALL